MNTALLEKNSYNSRKLPDTDAGHKAAEIPGNSLLHMSPMQHNHGTGIHGIL